MVASIGEDLCTRLYELDMANLVSAREAITDMDHLTSVYPSTMLAQDVQAVQADYQTPFDSQHWYRVVVKRSVSTFLSPRVEAWKKRNEQADAALADGSTTG